MNMQEIQSNKYNQEKFRTSDLALATTLSLFEPIESIDMSNKPRAYFEFHSGPELEGLINMFWNGEMLVEPKKFFGQLRTIKSRLYET